jgi:hypothetical protein
MFVLRNGRSVYYNMECWAELVKLAFIDIVQGVQLKRGPYFNMSNLFTKIYNMLYYTTNLYLQ